MNELTLVEPNWKAMYQAKGEQQTLRDQMAMAALMGMYPLDGAEISRDDYAKEAYAVADAMLKEREVKG